MYLQINMTALWIVGIICIAIGVAGMVASKKGWLK